MFANQKSSSDQAHQSCLRKNILRRLTHLEAEPGYGNYHHLGLGGGSDSEVFTNDSWLSAQGSALLTLRDQAGVGSTQDKHCANYLSDPHIPEIIVF